MPSASSTAPGANGSGAPGAGAYRRDPEGGGERVTIVPTGSPLELLAKLVSETGEPYALVYVLLECWTFRPEGRYQAPQPLSGATLGTFLTSFSDFLEEDGRHGLWVMSGAEPATVAMDRRGVVTAFGEVGRWPPVLARLGFTEGEVRPGPARKRIPERDQDEARLLAAMPWRWNALEPGDDALE
jgi:hypothetical protein